MIPGPRRSWVHGEKDSSQGSKLGALGRPDNERQRPVCAGKVEARVQECDLPRGLAQEHARNTRELLAGPGVERRRQARSSKVEAEARASVLLRVFCQDEAWAKGKLNGKLPSKLRQQTAPATNDGGLAPLRHGGATSITRASERKAAREVPYLLT